MLESVFQAHLIVRLRELFPGCHIQKNDLIQQGYPDLLILYGNRWAMLEVKRSEKARYQPNQLYYIDMFGAMSFVAAIYPENEEDVLYDLQQAFRSRR